MKAVYLIALSLFVVVGCSDSNDSNSSGVDKDSLAAANGKGDDSRVFEKVCQELGEDKDCDPCEVLEWYDDGTCDDFCPAHDQDCGDPSFVVKITDTTTDAESCDINDPGSDIIFVALENELGEVLGYGNAVADFTVADNNDYNLLSNIDGTEPGFEGVCPTFDETTVTSLGCGGSIGIQFLDRGGRVLPVLPNTFIRVFEFGGQCETGSTSDSYSVSVCTDADAFTNLGDDSSCTNELGEASGEAAFQVF